MSVLVRCGLWLLLTISCGVVVAEPPSARIINGTPTDNFEAVGVLGDEIGGFCTATLIGPRHILTTAHCAMMLSDGDDGLFELNGEFYETRAVFIHPGFDPATGEHDIAVIELGQEVEEVDPARLFRSDPEVGDQLTIVGYGVGGTPAGGASGSFGTKRFGVTTVDEVDNYHLYWIYDDPSQSNSAPGDSGGPAFIEIDGTYYIAAVITGGSKPDASLGDEAINTRVDAYLSWIDPIVAPSEEPDGEEPPDADPPVENPEGENPPAEEPDDQEPEQDAESCLALENLRQAFWDFVETLPIVRFIKELGVELGWWTLTSPAEKGAEG